MRFCRYLWAFFCTLSMRLFLSNCILSLSSFVSSSTFLFRSANKLWIESREYDWLRAIGLIVDWAIRILRQNNEKFSLFRFFLLENQLTSVSFKQKKILKKTQALVKCFTHFWKIFRPILLRSDFFSSWKI